MELNLSIKQVQTLTPQMIMSLEILQMSYMEVDEYLQDLVEVNPVVQPVEHTSEIETTELLRNKLEWLKTHNGRESQSYTHDTDEDAVSFPDRSSGNKTEETLLGFLQSQLPYTDDKVTAEARLLLIGCINKDGWLDEDLECLAYEYNISQKLLERELMVIQSLEPAGIGARDLSECICLQLKRLGLEDGLAMTIAERYLDDLGKYHFSRIAKETGKQQEDVREALGIIRQLEPKPGMGFSQWEETSYIVPDLTVTQTSEGFELITNDCFFPRITISDYYLKLLRETEDNDVREYLENKLRQAKWTTQALNERKNSILACAQVILELQENFFTYGPGHLVPMCLADVACRVGVHESTVSRAMKGKYIQCSFGTFPMSSFLSRNLGTDRGVQSSPDRAKAILKELIEAEDSSKPLSDQKLSDQLEKMGCTCSRRTVAKYRSEMGIPDSCGRKHLIVNHS